MTDREVRAFFSSVDAADLAALRTAFDPEIVLVMGNADPVRGSDDVLAAFQNVSEQFSSIRHEVNAVWRGTWERGGVCSAECIATYKREGGEAVSLPVTSTLRLTPEGKVAEYRIYMDPSPVFG